MSARIAIPANVAGPLQRHLFQGEMEQGAFLFARETRDGDVFSLVIEDSYLVPSSGWEVQRDIYLQMKDTERAKIMKLAREKLLCAIDCHSHPHAGDDVWFSPSDVAGITDFATYAHWKLPGHPFAAIVWGESSVDAVVWSGDFSAPEVAREISIPGKPPLIPTGSWFQPKRGFHRFPSDE